MFTIPSISSSSNNQDTPSERKCVDCHGYLIMQNESYRWYCPNCHRYTIGYRPPSVTSQEQEDISMNNHKTRIHTLLWRRKYHLRVVKDIDRMLKELGKVS